jgi:hypothetical protein
MNNEWIEIENKLRFIGTSGKTLIDFNFHNTMRALQTCLLSLMTHKLGFSNDGGIYKDAKNSLDKCILTFSMMEDLREDEKETLYKLREFVYKNF